VTVALVTGASSGIGEAIAVQLASQGIQTFGAARGIVKMEKLVAAGGTALSLDLTLPASIDDCIEQVMAKAGRIDILVNAAGAALYGAIEDVSIEDARTLFDVNLFGAAALIQKVAPLMRAQRAGHIINISTVGGVIASPYGGWYHATKFALEGLSASLRQELNPFGVDVVVIRPEAIRSGWRAIAGATLIENSGDGPYKVAARAMHDKYMSAGFEKMLADPAVVAKLVARIIATKRPKSVYLVPFMAKVTLTLVTLMGSDRLRDAFVRKFIGLPRTL
jgi:NAD(P)-dependent dehydrogenase (short-subunit alcohol dehydrogenase family)